MRLTIERAALLKALGHVQSVVERRNTIPILSNVLLAADKERVTFASDVRAAKLLAKSGEAPSVRTLDPVDVAAWTVVASTIMNTDEAVNKR